jgi:uncharacterized membrane protein required for colicin V production
MNYLDIAVLAVIVIFVIFGFVGGFMKALTSLGAILVSLFAAIFFAQTMANLIGGIGGMRDGLGGLVTNMFQGDIFTKQIDPSDPGAIAAALTDLGIPSFLVGMMVDGIVAVVPPGEMFSLASYLSPLIVDAILFIISFITIFLVVKLLMSLLLRFVNIVLKNRTLRIGDRVLGGVLGVVKAYLVLCLLLMLYDFLSPSLNTVFGATEMLNTSRIAATIHQNNIVTKLFNMIPFDQFFNFQF